MPDQTKLPMYQCIKRVRASRITGVVGPVLDTPRRVETEHGAFDAAGHQFDKAEPGWWFVQYPDGYTSASPAAAFEDGYLELQQFFGEPSSQTIGDEMRRLALSHACSLGLQNGESALKAANRFLAFLRGESHP